MLDNKYCALKGNQKLFLIHLNQATSCCRAHPTTLDKTKTIDHYVEGWKEESQLLNQGIKLDGCKHCWNDEDRGVKSYRQIHTNTDNIVQIFLSNLCNQMCSYCSPQFSSEWQNSIKQEPFTGISLTTKKNLEIIATSSEPNIWLEKIFTYINTCEPNSVSIRFLGGEPLMQIQTLSQFQKFDQNKIKEFRIITNLNPPTPKFLNWVVKNFPKEKLKINVSLDATPEYNHIPRGLFDKEMFYQNLKTLEDNQVSFTMMSVISVLSIFDLKNFLIWLNKNNYHSSFHALNNPDCLDIKFIPLFIRNLIWDSIKDLDPAPVIHDQLLQPGEQVDVKLFEQYNYLNQYFNRINLNPLVIQNNLFQEYWGWLIQQVEP